MNKPVTHFQVKHVKDKLAESLGRGNGAILFRRKREGASVFVFYRYFRGNSPVTISLGEYDQKIDKNRKRGLEYCRTEAFKLANIRREISPLDLKDYLKQQEDVRVLEQEKAKQKAELEASRGTFEELLKSYVGCLKAAGKASAGEVERALNREVLSHKCLGTVRAREITAENIRQLLAPVYKRGSRTMGNRLRSYLLAAFSFGLETDLDPEREGDKVFCLEYNPVAAIKTKRDAEHVGERSLNHQEVKQLWDGVTNTENVGPVMALFIQFLFALAGQRPKQVLACKWDSYNLKEGTVTIINTKNRQQKLVKHVVPLTQRARDILTETELYTGHHDWPFTSRGNAPFTVAAVNKAVRRYVISTDSIHFSPRDFRRTVKNLLIDAGLNREQRNLLQGHGQTGVDVKHYERHDHLPTKRAGIAKYDQLLNSILSSQDDQAEHCKHGDVLNMEHLKVAK